eukprot:TRINITY_DN2220_c1_g1_i1.p1 TRINITY_DN2220_c1_g1~~TRINITY_DN2220_c1_g1_i1.p1  ORF type:complete len:162 (+),score=23.06 TRINITY_DN2220_c1_g1_i1:140-625(+)
MPSDIVSTTSHEIISLSNPLIVRIFSFLGPRDIVRMSKTSQQMKKISASKPMDVIWWKHCMRKWYTPDQIPKVMPKKKADWKHMYFTVGSTEEELATAGPPVNNSISRKKLLEQQKEEEERQKANEVKEPTKEEMRMYYKSVRSKPKDKRPQHTTREFFTV